MPIQYTDFIFSVFAEEFGFVGSVLLMLMLVAYGAVSLWVALKSKRVVHQLVAMGVMILLIGQSLLNIGVATGALPTTGLPLPLFSYGGSSMISSLITAALLIRVARESHEAEVVTLRRSPLPRLPHRNRDRPASQNLSRSDRALPPTPIAYKMKNGVIHRSILALRVG